MITAKVVSPPPPPTSNTLTQGQRTRLMRTTKKLGQVLGSTPHLLDAKYAGSPTPMYEDWSDDEEKWYRPESRGSTSTSSAIGSTSGRISRSASISTRSTKSSSSSHDEDSWSSHSSKPPLLRLALSSFSQRRSSISKCPSSPTSSNTSDEEDTRYMLPAHVEENPRDSLISPTFRIPTSNTIRLQKMDRIRKKLGDGVPVELVFPVDTFDEEKSPSPSKNSTVVHFTSKIDTHTLKTLPPLPTLPAPRPPRPSRSHYAGARDSIVSTSAHRGPRVKRKPVPKLDLSETELSPVPSPSPVTPSSKSKHARLSLILENVFEVDLLVESKVSCSSEKTSEWFNEDETEQWVDYQTFLRTVQDL